MNIVIVCYCPCIPSDSEEAVGAYDYHGSLVLQLRNTNSIGHALSRTSHSKMVRPMVIKLIDDMVGVLKLPRLFPTIA